MRTQARKHHELWEKLEKNTKDSYCTALWKWIVSLVKNLCSLTDHAKPSHHCCLVPYKQCTHRHGATIRAMTQQYIQLSSVCCSLRTYWLKWLQRTPKIPLGTSGLPGKHFQDSVCPSDSTTSCHYLPCVCFLMSLVRWTCMMSCLLQRASARCSAPPWRGFQQRNTDQSSEQQGICCNHRSSHRSSSYTMSSCHCMTQNPCCLSNPIAVGPGRHPLRDGFQATSLDHDEVERILDACIQHADHWKIFKVAAMASHHGLAWHRNWVSEARQAHELIVVRQ